MSRPQGEDIGLRKALGKSVAVVIIAAKDKNINSSEFCLGFPVKEIPRPKNHHALTGNYTTSPLFHQALNITIAIIFGRKDNWWK